VAQGDRHWRLDGVAVTSLRHGGAAGIFVETGKRIPVLTVGSGVLLGVLAEPRHMNGKRGQGKEILVVMIEDATKGTCVAVSQEAII
jgi:hypothetical protein